MTIRKFKDSDFPEIVDIYTQSKLDELKFESKAFTFLPLEKDNKRLTELMQSDIYVFESPGESEAGNEGISGYGAHYGSEIRALFVKPKFRGKKVGQKLLEFMLSKIGNNACLYVASTNTPAIELYRRYGFKAIEKIETNYNATPVSADKMIRTIE